ncbi:MAG TPA: hypothetical protein VGB20_01720 [bacterium]
MGRTGCRMRGVAAGVLALAGWASPARASEHDAAPQERGAPIAQTQEQSESAMSTEPSYESYAGDDLGRPVRFQYPSQWTVQFDAGQIQAYRQLLILGPRNAEETFRAQLVVRSSPTKEAGGRFSGPGELIANLTGTVPEGASADEGSARDIADTPARDITLSYVIPPMHKTGLKSLPIPVRQRTVVLQRGSELVELVYSADAREYERHAGAFDRLLGTLQFP